MRSTLLLAAAVTGLGLLTACSTPTAAPTTTTTTTTPSPTTTSPTTTAQAAPDGSAAHPFAFGHTWGGPGTLSITVGAPAAYTPSSAFAPGSIPRAVVLDIEVANPAGSPPMPAPAITFQVTAGQAKAEQLSDPANGVGMPQGSIAPGQTLKWKLAYSVPTAPGDLTVQVGLIYSTKPVYFAGKI
ncbi:hypothetical protein [Kutzneria sp. NPDC052558]|uniref:hypothetical protein n=1 Tax=Kutzneria sp. NPDC052558 TaxID=3364121 RepID=UPI0037C4F97F